MALTHQCLWWLPGIAPVLLCWMRISFLQLTLCLSVRLPHVFVLGYNLQACIACMQPPMKRIALHHLCHEVDVTRCEGCLRLLHPPASPMTASMLIWYAKPAGGHTADSGKG